MKTPLVVLLRVLLIAGAIWIFFLVLHPSAPPDADETLVIVLLALIVERGATLLWRWLRRRRRGGGTTAASIAVLALLGPALEPAAAPGLAAGLQGDGVEESPQVSADAPREPILVCRPDPPAVGVGGQVEVRAFVDPPPTGAVWTWTAMAGEVVGGGERVIWKPDEIEPGYYTVTAELTGGEGFQAECIVRIRVRRGMKSGTSLSGRSYLDCGSNARETLGYGLYSYLLLPARPTGGGVEERYLSALRGFVALAGDVEEFQLGIPRRETHVTYLTLAGGDGPPDRAGELPAWILEYYDWGCAHELLAFVPTRPSGVGPYVVSVRRPLISGGTIAPGEEHLLQDLSLVEADLMELWIREFLIQTRQAEFWEPRTGPRLALQLRTSLSLLAQATGAVRPALNDWLQWLGERSE